VTNAANNAAACRENVGHAKRKNKSKGERASEREREGGREREREREREKNSLNFRTLEDSPILSYTLPALSARCVGSLTISYLLIINKHVHARNG